MVNFLRARSNPQDTRFRAGYFVATILTIQGGLLAFAALEHSPTYSEVNHLLAGLSNRARSRPAPSLDARPKGAFGTAPAFPALLRHPVAGESVVNSASRPRSAWPKANGGGTSRWPPRRRPRRKVKPPACRRRA